MSNNWLRNATKVQITLKDNHKIYLAGDYNKIKNYLLQIQTEIKFFDIISNINLKYSYIV
jgi:hypothetical protein